MNQLPKRVKHQLSKHKLLQQAIKTAKKDGYLEVTIDSCEKWNNGPNSLVETPKEDGSFDVEGHSCCDVRARVYVPWLSFGYWAGAVGPWFKDLFGVRSWAMLKVYLEHHPFTKYFDGWLWVVDSFLVAKSQYAEEIVDLTRPELLGKNNFQERNQEIEKVTATITDKQLQDHLSLNGVRLNHCLWAVDTDYTCMVANEIHNHKFDLKDGWSNFIIRRIIRDWWTYTDQPHTQIRMRKHDVE